MKQEILCCEMLFGMYLQLQITTYVILEVPESDLLLPLPFEHLLFYFFF